MKQVRITERNAVNLEKEKQRRFEETGLRVTYQLIVNELLTKYFEEVNK